MSERLPLQMIGGLVVGLVLGVIAHLLLGGSAFLEGLVHYVVEPIGQIFLRLLFMLVIPLVVSALALAVAELGDLRQLGRIGAKTFAYTLVVSTIAVGIGVTLVNLVEPGTLYGDRVNEIDLRVAKILRFGRTRTNVGFDIYNVTNSNPVLTYNQAFNPTINTTNPSANWLAPQSTLQPRFVKFSAQIDF